MFNGCAIYPHTFEWRDYNPGLPYFLFFCLFSLECLPYDDAFPYVCLSYVTMENWNNFKNKSCDLSNYCCMWCVCVCIRGWLRVYLPITLYLLRTFPWLWYSPVLLSWLDSGLPASLFLCPSTTGVTGALPSDANCTPVPGIRARFFLFTQQILYSLSHLSRSQFFPKRQERKLIV